MIVIGLTGSIAMGKSQTANILRRYRIPVFDSDAIVHDIYENDVAVISAIAAVTPESYSNGKIDRTILSEAIIRNPKLLEEVERIVHPVIRARRDDFVFHCRQDGAQITVLDMPLLFETHQAGTVDKIIVVSAPEKIQRERILARRGMSQKKMDFILSRQLPDAEKQRLGDYIIDTSKGLEDAHRQVQEVLTSLSEREKAPRCEK